MIILCIEAMVGFIGIASLHEPQDAPEQGFQPINGPRVDPVPTSSDEEDGEEYDDTSRDDNDLPEDPGDLNAGDGDDGNEDGDDGGSWSVDLPDLIVCLRRQCHCRIVRRTHPRQILSV